jgi:hypothetical protein
MDSLLLRETWEHYLSSELRKHGAASMRSLSSRGPKDAPNYRAGRSASTSQLTNPHLVGSYGYHLSRKHGWRAPVHRERVRAIPTRLRVSGIPPCACIPFTGEPPSILAVAVIPASKGSPPAQTQFLEAQSRDCEIRHVRGTEVAIPRKISRRFCGYTNFGSFSTRSRPDSKVEHAHVREAGLKLGRILSGATIREVSRRHSRFAQSWARMPGKRVSVAGIGDRNRRPKVIDPPPFPK